MQFETERLLIRPIQASDHDAMQVMILDPQVVAYLRYRTLETPAAFDDAFKTHFMADSTTTFGLERKRDHQLIGFYEFHVDDHMGELTYALSPSAWGHGYVAEAGQEMMTYGFKNLGLTRIEAHYASANPRSGRVMAKLGMHDEGELQTFTLPSGELIHVMAYGLNKNEWQREKSA